MSDFLKTKAEETAKLTRELQRLGIDLPPNRDLCFDDMDDHGGTIDEIGAATNYYLTDKGESTARRLIRDEKRKNVEWWVKVIGSIVALLTGLLGAFIGVLAFWKR